SPGARTDSTLPSVSSSSAAATSRAMVCSGALPGSANTMRGGRGSADSRPKTSAPNTPRPTTSINSPRADKSVSHLGEQGLECLLRRPELLLHKGLLLALELQPQLLELLDVRSDQLAQP